MREPKPADLSGRFVDLTLLAPEHAELTLAWRMGARARMLNTGADTVERQREWIVSRPPSERNYLIVLKDGRPVGMVSLVNIDLHVGKAEPARFLIGEEGAARGVPVAAEALLLLYRLAFDTLALRRLYGVVASSNRPMMKFHEFSGMRREGVLREHLFLAGKFQDGVVYGLLEPEFRAVTIGRLEGLINIARAKESSMKGCYS